MAVNVLELPGKLRIQEEDLGEFYEAAETMWLFRCVDKGLVDELRVLLSSRIEPDRKDYDDRTPLHIAAAAGSINVAKLLLENRASAAVCDQFGMTPLHQAERAGQQAMEELITSQSVAKRLCLRNMRRLARMESWLLDRSELKYGDELCSTLKSTVWKATWRGSMVVVKRNKVDPHLEESEERVAELLNEIQILATLRHPDLVMFLGACLDEGEQIVFVTEFMEGGDVERFYRTKSLQKQAEYRPGLAQVVRWSSAVARALAFLHNCPRKVIHRDLKPMNLLLTSNLDIKVTDFGISKVMQTQGRTSTHYMTGGVGTWIYMAPEVVRHQPYTEAADIYSFALIMYFLHTGTTPFFSLTRGDSEVVLKEYLKGNEPRPEISKCHKALRPILCAAWQADLSLRLSAIEISERLEDIPWRNHSEGCIGGCTMM